MKLLRTLSIFTMCCFLSAPALAQKASEPLPSSSFDFTPLITDGLLDPDTPIEHRRELAKRLIEATVREKSPNLLYLVGSLYRQGDQAGIAPFPQDLDRAREYLTRASLGGWIGAMRKLALLELDADNQFEANLWAQLYVHYSKTNDANTPVGTYEESKRARRESPGLALLKRTSDGFPESQFPKMVERAEAMIRQYDNVIRTYQKIAAAEPMPRVTMHNLTKATRTQVTRELGRNAPLAEAEFFVEYSPEGTLLRAWPLDGRPVQKVFRVLRVIVNGTTIEAAPAGTTTNRVFLLPVAFLNSFYQLKPDKVEE